MSLCAKRTERFTKLWVYVCVVGTFFHSLQPLMRGQAYERFPFHTEYGTWALKSPYYEILYFIQIIGNVQVGLIFASFLAFYVTVTRLMTAQFDMLLCSIKNIANSACMARGDGQSRTVLRKSLWQWRDSVKVGREYYEGEAVEEEGLKMDKLDQNPLLNLEEEHRQDLHNEDIFEYGEYDDEVLKAVIECARRHAIILKISKSLEDIVNLNMLNTIGSVTTFICVMIFVIYTVAEVNNTTIDCANYLVLGYFELLLLCYYPHLMSHQSGRIIEAISETPWYLFGPKVRKHLKIIMINSQEPFYFTCGKLFNVDLTIFVMSLKASLSYFIALKNLHN